MRLVALAAILATCQADLLNRSYLPSASAKNAGGSDGAIAAPTISQRRQNEQIQRQNVNNNNQYQTSFIKPVFKNQISSNPSGQSNNVVRFGTNLQTNTPLNSYGETINGNTNTLLRSGNQREGNTRKSTENEANGHRPHDQTQEITSLNKVASEGSKTNENKSSFDEFEYRKDVYQTFVEKTPNFHDEKANNNGKSPDSGASILRLDKQMASDAYSYSFETENGISAGENAVLTNGIQTQGGYSYTGDDGQVYTVRYIADASGYRPIGNHLPTPPPIPDDILKSIEDNARAVAAGQVDDGYYHEQQYNTENINQDGSSYPRHNSGSNTEYSRTYLPPVSGIIAKDATDALRKYLPTRVEAENNYHIINNVSPLKLVQSTSGEANSLIHRHVVEETSTRNTNLNVNQILPNNNSSPNQRPHHENHNTEKTNKIENGKTPLVLQSNDLHRPQVDVTPSILEKKVEIEEKVTPHAINPTEIPSSNIIPFPTLITPKQQLTTPKEDQSTGPIDIHKPNEQDSKNAQNIAHNNDQQNNSTQRIRETQSNDHTEQTTFNQTISAPTGDLELVKTTVAPVPVSPNGYQYNHPQGIASSHFTDPNKVRNTSPVPNGQSNFGIGDGLLVNKEGFFGDVVQVHNSGTVENNKIQIDEASALNNHVQQQVIQFQQSNPLNSEYDATSIIQGARQQAQLEHGTSTLSDVHIKSNVNNNRNTDTPQREINQFVVSNHIQTIPSANSIPQVQQHSEPDVRLSPNSNSQNLKQNAVSGHNKQQDTSLKNNYLNQFTSNNFNQISSSNANTAPEANTYSSSFNSASGNLVHTNGQQTFQGANQAVIANDFVRNSDINTHNNNERVHEQYNYNHRSTFIKNIAADQKYNNNGIISANHPHAIPSQYSHIQPSSLPNFQSPSAINNNQQNQYQTTPSNTFLAHSRQGVPQFNNVNQDRYVLPTPQTVTSQSPSLQKYPNNPASLQNEPLLQRYTIHNNIAQSRQPISYSTQPYPYPDTLNNHTPQSPNRQIDQGYIYTSPFNPQQIDLNPTSTHNDNEYQHQHNIGNTGFSSNTDNERRSFNNIQANYVSNPVYSSQLPQQHYVSQPQSIYQFNQNQAPPTTLIGNQSPQIHNNPVQSDIQNLLPSFQPTQSTTTVHHEQYQNRQPINYNDGNFQVNSEYDRSHSTVSKSPVSQNSAIADYNAPRYNQKLSHTATTSGAIQNSYTGVPSLQLQNNEQYSNNGNNRNFHAASISQAVVQGSTRNSQGSSETVPLSNSERFPDHRRLPNYNGNNKDSHAESISQTVVQGSTRNSQGSSETVPLSNSERFPDHRRLPSYNSVAGYRY